MRTTEIGPLRPAEEWRCSHGTGGPNPMVCRILTSRSSLLHGRNLRRHPAAHQKMLAHIRSHSSQQSCLWARVGRQPLLRSTDGRTNSNIISAAQKSLGIWPAQVQSVLDCLQVAGGVCGNLPKGRTRCECEILEADFQSWLIWPLLLSKV